MQPASEKRRLLDFVVSNCSWANGELTVEFRQPFDLIALGVDEAKRLKVAGADSDDLHQVMYSDSTRLPLILVQFSYKPSVKFSRSSLIEYSYSMYHCVQAMVAACS